MSQSPFRDSLLQDSEGVTDQVNASRHGTPGQVVAVEDGMVAWTGRSTPLMRQVASMRCSAMTTTKNG